ncbi:MAG: aspartate kinase [Proteobacteria bacterium]|nr:aspartate kinase [Pseudomonadota bacterium]
MKIVKFGGKLLRDAAAFQRAVQIVAEMALDGGAVCVVLSAIFGGRDELRSLSAAAAAKDVGWAARYEAWVERHVDMARALASDVPGASPDEAAASWRVEPQALRDILTGVFDLGELSDKVLARILAFGPNASVALFQAACTAVGLEATYRDARQLIVTDDQFCAAHVDGAATREALREHLGRDSGVSVLAGSVGATEKGLPTDLGRNGADYTMSLVASALEAKSAQLFTEGAGVSQLGGAAQKNADVIAQMSFAEAMELSHYGSSVLHAHALQPLQDARIPLWIRSFAQPDAPGTRVGEGAAQGRSVTGVSTICDVSLLHIGGSGMTGVMGTAARLFGVLAAHDINVILITQGSSEQSICVALLPEDAQRAVVHIAEEFAREIARRTMEAPWVEPGVSVLGVVGENMRRRPGISGRLFCALGEAGVNVAAIAQGANELNISLVIAKADVSRAQAAIQRAFFGADQAGCQ